MEKSCGKIGVGLITYNRPEYYQQVLKTIPKDKIDALVIVNDGTNTYVNDSDGDYVAKNNAQLGVAISKNVALRALIEKFECEYLFIIEDDILIKDPTVFEEYIKAANSTGVHHLCYEKVAGNEKTLKYTLEQPDGSKLGFYFHPQGAFMYIHANLVKKLGYFDESYMNAYEHIDFAYNLIKKYVAPPFWYFPDLLNSEKYLTDIEGSTDNSSITNRTGYMENVDKSARHFIKKWGHFTSDIEDVDINTLEKVLSFLQLNYSRKKGINKNKKLSVIIPYRDRKRALDLLIPKLTEYISKQVENYELIVVEQNDDKLFNKGLLNNIGFLLNPDSDYHCFHDVDLLPEVADYSYPTNPVHMSTYCSQFNYTEDPAALMGGVIVFRKEHFELANGYPVNCVGWGSEDNILGERVKRVGLSVYRYPFGRFYSVPHTPRIQNPMEYNAHLENGKIREDEKSGKTSMKDNGLSNIDLNKFEIITEEKQNFKHIKIKKL
jgi:hypothetical protein